jgi:hypothetical protein
MKKKLTLKKFRLASRKGTWATLIHKQTVVRVIKLFFFVIDAPGTNKLERFAPNNLFKYSLTLKVTREDPIHIIALVRNKHSSLFS